MKTTCAALSGLILAILSVPAFADDPPALPFPPDDCQAEICISKAYRPTIDSGGVMVAPSAIKRADPDAVKALGARIEFIFFDVIRTWNPPPGTKFCAATGCIYVERRCNDIRCDYTYGRYREELGIGAVPTGRQVIYPGTMGIIFTSREALTSAERNVFFAIGPEENKTMVSLFAINAFLAGSNRDR